jgi:hypothetical protein
VKNLLEIGNNIVQQTQPSQNPGSNQLIKFHSEKVFDCYFQLHDWQEYLRWYEEYKQLINKNQSNESLRQQLENKVDLNYIKSMCSFEQFDSNAAHNYAQEIVPFNLENLNLWNTDELEAFTFKQIFESMINKKYFIN